MADEPKLIIDTDWKSQAQAEKERLAQKTAQKAPGPEAGLPGKPGEGGEVKFEDIVYLLATQAMSYMGYFADPQTGQAVVSPEYAKLHIDMLGILEQKTKGNLSEPEQAFMSKILNQLRMDFVEIQKAVEKAVAEGRIKPMAPGVRPSAAPGRAPGAAPAPGMGSPPGAQPPTQ